jgi:double-stranded uracil-DNA glycosylase
MSSSKPLSRSSDRGAIPLRKPTREEIASAAGKTVPDLIGPGLRVLFCGINPSLYSAAVGHHFARPGNRFWPMLHAGGLVDHVLSPHEGQVLLSRGFGITNIADRATARADELTAEELAAGARRLEAKVRRHAPAVVAVLGVTAYRTAFNRPRSVLGLQAETIAGARIWVLPNPSGRNGHFTIEPFRALCRAVPLKI